MLKTLNASIEVNSEVTKNIRIAIIRTDYHQEMLKRLEQKCRETLQNHHVSEEHIKTFIVPGSWEIPVAARTAAESKKFDVIIAFGIILKGQTYHFEMIANECARAMMQLSLNYGIPIINEVLAVNDMRHAEERSGLDDKNKGIEAATAALKIFATLEKIKHE